MIEPELTFFKMQIEALFINPSELNQFYFSIIQ
jgi:hypothetical protein